MVELAEIFIQELSSTSTARRRIAAQELLKITELSDTQKEQISAFLALETDGETHLLLQRIFAIPPVEAGALTVGCWERALPVRKAILAGLSAKNVPPEAQEVIKSWIGREKDPGILLELLDRVRRYATAADTPLFIGLLGHPWSGVRSRALTIVSEKNPSGLVCSLPGLLKSPDVRIRLDALKALDRLLPREAGRILREALDADDPEARIMALHAAFTFDFAQIALSVVRLLLCETDREAMRLAGLLAITNPDPEIAGQIATMAEKVAEARSGFLKNLAGAIMKGAQLAGLISREKTWEEWLEFYKKKRSSGAGQKISGTVPADSQPAERTMLTASPELSAASPIDVDALERNLTATAPETVITAFDALRLKHSERIEMHLQPLLRHSDPRIRLRALVFLKSYDPDDLRRELKAMLNSLNVQFQREAVRLAFLTDAELVTPIFLDHLDHSSSEQIREQLELFFITNPSMNLLKTLILKQAERTAGKVVLPELVNKVYHSLQQTSSTPLSPLEDIAEKIVPPAPPATSELARLTKAVKRIQGNAPQNTPGSEIRKAAEEMIASAAPQLIGFLVTVIVLMLGARFFFLPSDAMGKGSAVLTRPASPTPSARGEPIRLSGTVLSLTKNRKYLMIKTPTGKVRIFSKTPFADHKIGAAVQMRCVSRRLKTFGVPSYDFLDWQKLETGQKKAVPPQLDQPPE